MTNITLITRPECNYCDNAKTILTRRGYTYTEKLIGHDIQRETVLEMYPTQNLLPVVLIDEQLLGGYTDLLDWLNPALDEGETDAEQTF